MVLIFLKRWPWELMLLVIARPFVTAVFGGGKEGVKVYIEKLAAELKDTMAMCGAFTLKEITSEMVRRS